MPVVLPKNENNLETSSKEVRYDTVLMEPGEYEVTKDSIFVIKVPLKQKKNEKWWVIVDENNSDVVEKVVFRMWTYDEMVELRKLATKYDPIRRIHMIDHDILNRLKIQRFMKSWTFGRNNPRLAIHHVNGVMTDESWDAVVKLQTNILKFLIDKINEIYEYGL
jgi:hypothetical protein